MRPGEFFERLRAAGLVLALAALSFKAFLPPGFMLDAHPRGGVVITLCGGDDVIFNPATGSYEKPGGHSPTQTNQSEHCPYAAAATPTVAPVANTLVALATATTIDAGSPLQPPARTFDAAGPPLPARGPPLSA